MRGHPLSSALPLGRGLFHRFGRIFCNLLRRLSLAYRQVSGVPHGAKSLQNLSPKATWFYLTNLTFPIFRYRVPSQYSPSTGQALAHRSRSFSVPRSLCGAAFIHAFGVKRRITAHLGVSSARLGRGHGQTSGWAAPLALVRRQSAPFFAV